MSKADHKGNPKKEPPHLRLYEWLTESKAWKDLSTRDRALYILLKQKYRGINNGRIILSVRQACENLHVGKTAAAESFASLEAHGFVEIVIRGSFEGRKDGRATEWRLTEHNCDVSGDLASKRFMSWEPGRNLTVRPGGQSVPESGQSVPQRGLSRPIIPKTVPQRGL